MEGDVEATKSLPERIPYWHLILDKAPLTQAMIDWKYEGSGTESDPFLVTWIDNDPRNPHGMPTWRKWLITAVLSIATLAVAFNSSSYSGCIFQIIETFDASDEVAALGLSLYVLGFAVGPILWAPLSEIYGRQPILFITFAALTAFNAGCAGAKNIWTLVILRFFAGTFGASPLTNAGAVIADMFTLSQRGFAMSLFATAPFLGPVLGPIVGGFLGQSEGWRWVMGVAAIFTGVLWIIGAMLIPETFAPVILERRAEKLSAITGKYYISKGQLNKEKRSTKEELQIALCRPWQLMFYEPIVLLLCIFMSIIYGTLYLFFGALPIVYQEKRGWNEGEGGLAFLGIAVGMIGAVGYSIFDSRRFAARPASGRRPEDRLSGAKIGAIATPVSLFWFAWTNSPSIPWPASVCAGIMFGFGMVLIFISLKNYLVDAYTIYAASVLAATVISRSFFGAAFPLFTTQMYHNLGIHWATMIPAFLALACTPLPFLFYIYGEQIRSRCKYAGRAQAYLKSLSVETPKSKQNNETGGRSEAVMESEQSSNLEIEKP
ncbi:major facilitator superfamily domain-containing protein [Xylogone sp. PMI_703]|nr:major facilitator superfamily domain-containing protein [Xylogone sp. PMI_703]